MVPRPRRSPISGVSRPSLPFKARLVIVPLRRDSSQVEAAQRLAVEAGDGAELDVEIDILVMLLLAVGGRSAPT